MKRVRFVALSKALAHFVCYLRLYDEEDWRLSTGNLVPNRIKRRLREAFRQVRHTWPPGLDVIVVAAPHEPLSPDRYAKGMSACVEHLARVLLRRAARRESDASGEPS